MKHLTTPENVTTLGPNEIFVFGSNLRGMHGGGAARVAYEKFGAEWGIGVGRTGHCYAIPTMQGGVDTICPYVNEFIQYAKEHSELVFLVTRVGCGIAGFSDQQIAPLFEAAKDMRNVALPTEWRIILNYGELLEYTRFYKGEHDCPFEIGSPEGKLWHAEMMFCDCFPMSLFNNRTDNIQEQLNEYVPAYIGKWNPYNWEDIVQIYKGKDK